MSFSFLFEMTWKSAAIIGAALMLTALLRSRAAADRSAVLRLAVGLLLLLPPIALFLPALPVEMAAEETQPLPLDALLATASAAPVEVAPLEPVPVTIWDDPSALIGIVYAAGLLMVALRIAGGLWTLRRWTRAARPVEERTWVDALGRARPATATGANVRLLVSDESPSPLSWGLLKPVILIDRDTLERPQDAEAIIAHEMAHVERRDWLALMMTRLSVALFWFNPLAWLLEREIVQQAEEAADLAALGQVEPAHYAQTLVSCAHHAVPLPANSMAPMKGGLGRRISAILDGRTRSRKSGSLLKLAAMLGCAAFAAPVAAVKLVPAMAQAADLPLPARLAAAPSAPAPAAPVPAAPPARAPEAPPAHAATAAPTPPAAPAETISVPAIDVDVPAIDVKMPAIKMVVNGQKVAVPAVAISAPRMKVNVPAMEIAVPELPMPPSMAAAAAVAAMHPHPGWTQQDREEFEKELNEARREARGARLEAQRARREGRHAGDTARLARRQARIGMSQGAVGMERGAEGMLRGARRMEEEADKLRSAEYRERQIAKAAEEGRTLTHQDLIDAIPRMKAGAARMVEGAARMREGAARMRQQSR